jgi:hypothetical protein
MDPIQENWYLESVNGNLNNTIFQLSVENIDLRQEIAIMREERDELRQRIANMMEMRAARLT